MTKVQTKGLIKGIINLNCEKAFDIIETHIILQKIKVAFGNKIYSLYTFPILFFANINQTHEYFEDTWTFELLKTIENIIVKNAYEIYGY